MAKESKDSLIYVTLKKNVFNIRQAVMALVDKQRADTSKSWEMKIKDLQNSILNIPSHIFGEHKRCKLYGLDCNNKTNCSEKELNYVPYLKAYGFYQKIEDHVKYLSCFSESLLHKFTNNIVESLNNIFCKEINGKRVNYACSNKYNTRAAIAIIQHNSQEALTQIYQGMGKEVSQTIKDFQTKRKLKILRTKDYRAMNGRKRKHVYTTADKHYGIYCERPDFTEEQLFGAREKHFQDLLENQKNRVNIEINTRKQHQSDLWSILRKKLLTSSKFGRICRLKPQTSCRTIVIEILFSSLDTPAMAYGRDKEEGARKELEKVIGKEIQNCGLFIDSNNSRLAASPDGLIDDDGIVEIKNPFRAIDLTAKEAMRKYADLNFVNAKTNGMKATHHCYYQIQGQLHITQRKYCVFALNTPKSMEIRVVLRDDLFWQKKIEPYLSRFYDNCLLPEILDSRYCRKMPIRDPQYILEAHKKHQEKASIKKKYTLISLGKMKFMKQN